MKIVALVVLIAYVPSYVIGAPLLLVPEEEQKSDDSCLRSQLHGRMDASTKHNSGNWFVGGFFSGMLLGLIGTGVTVAISAGSSPTPEMAPEDPDIELACYIDGYESKARSKNMLSAGIGGFVGTAVWIAAYFLLIYDDK